MSLQLRGVQAGYVGTPVLRGVDLTVPAGRVVALLGPNGAGKTTLLRTCSGLLHPTAGTITLGGRDVTHARPHVLAGRGLCHIPENRAVFGGLTVRDNLRVMAGGRLRPDTIEEATEAFPVLGRRLDQLAGTMSGGEQQMLALTRAYLTAPRYVLLDEVSMGLAPIVVDQIFDFLRRLAARGVALLLVEQYVTKALALADMVYLLTKGVVDFAGEPTELDADALAARYLGAA
ncbi:MAG TPA: ABC transporter ATP-binding protein [Sporichthyaceae bacterium]|jgi:branched-chain amino acid transport system ATP-binding protein|nr:ABC transporter ATP-binding protein [Sporichthyaceae bacterium]